MGKDDDEQKSTQQLLVRRKNVDNQSDEEEREISQSDILRIEKESEKIFKVYQFRYANVLVYIFGMLQISIMQNSFAPQAAELMIVYNQSSFVYNLTSLIHMIVHVPVSFPANYIVDKYGTKVGNTIACVFCILACWTRCLVNTSFFFCILGQFFVGCANPFIINAINKISVNWFYPSDRAAVTGFLSFFSTVTGAVGLLIPGFYFSDYKAADDHSVDYQTGRDKTFDLMLIIAIMVSLMSLLNLLFYKDKPASPPSFSANTEREEFSVALKMLVKKKTYVLITICFALGYGTFIDFAVVLGELIDPYGFSSSQTSILSLCCVVSGVIGSVVMLKILNRTNAYKKLAVFGIVGCILSVLAMIGLLQIENFEILMIPALTLGFFIIPVIPILLELASEVCYPIGEASITGFIFTVAHIAGFLLGSGFSLIIDQADNKKLGSIEVLLSFIVIFLIALSTVFFMKQDLRRTEEEKAKAMEQQSNNSSTHSQDP